MASRRQSKNRQLARDRRIIIAAGFLVIAIAAILFSGILNRSVEYALPTEGEIRSLGYAVEQSGMEPSEGRYLGAHASFALNDGGKIDVFASQTDSNESARRLYSEIKRIAYNTTDGGTSVLEGGPLGDDSAYAFYNNTMDSQYKMIYQLNFIRGSFSVAVRFYSNTGRSAEELYRIGSIVANKLK